MDIKPKRMISNATHLVHRGKHFNPHTKLHKRNLAINRTSVDQRFFLVIVAVIVIGLIVVFPKAALLVIVALLSIYYLVDLVFTSYLSFQSLAKSPEITISEDELDRGRSDWPVYTILCPMYKEGAILPQFTAAMDRLDYPSDKLQILLILEADDHDTIVTARDLHLPPHYEIVVVPDSKPKTKPKACNYALQFATGEYTVIYDAEDVPDASQLKKAVIAFTERVESNVVCLQAQLNYYNIGHNLLTKAFTAEYSTWFGLTLPGLQYITAPIPLGGTSNHFKTTVLRELQGWDPFNVTEDADLGIRLNSAGYRTSILDSITLEEANSVYGGWLKQRSRWIKGYMQTYFVHTRYQNVVSSQNNLLDHLLFQLIVGGKVVTLFINPIMWLVTIAYFVFHGLLGPSIEALFPGNVFYIALTTLILGNFLYAYNTILGLAKRHQEELIPAMIFMPVYWLMMSLAACYALYELVVRPHYWQKTQHGLHLIGPESQL